MIMMIIIIIIVMIILIMIIIMIITIMMLHARNQHLGNHRGFSVVFSNGCSVAFSDGCSTFSGSLQRIVSFPVDFTGNVQWPVSGIFQWNFTFASSGV